jgi:hypothetical protein
MSDADVQNANVGMTVGKGIGIYALCLVCLVVLAKFAGGGVAFLAYFVLGFILNRVVLRGLIEWHPVYNTIDNVSSGKLRALIFWPISYLMLFFKLGVIRHL